MIIGTWDEYKPGEVVEGYYKIEQNRAVPAVIFIIREASYQEWIDYRLNHGMELIEVPNREKANYYEITTD